MCEIMNAVFSIIPGTKVFIAFFFVQCIIKIMRVVLFYFMTLGYF